MQTGILAIGPWDATAIRGTREGPSYRGPRLSRQRRPGHNRDLIGGGGDRRRSQRPAGEKCFEVATDGEGPMAGAQPAQAMAWLRLARWRISPTLGGVAFVAPPREGDRCAALRPSPPGTAMDEATLRQKRAVAALIARTAEPITFDEASRLIRDLKREAHSFPEVVAKIIEADHAGDVERLGRLLANAKRRMAHGAWLPLLRELGIHPRRAQRLMERCAAR